MVPEIKPIFTLKDTPPNKLIKIKNKKKKEREKWSCCSMGEKKETWMRYPAYDDDDDVATSKILFCFKIHCCFRIARELRKSLDIV